MLEPGWARRYVPSVMRVLFGWGRRWVAAGVLALGVGVAVVPAKEPPAAPRDRAELREGLSRRVDATAARGAAWGMQFVHAETGEVWFETNSARLFVPASNSKLFTVAMALDRFGTGHVFHTVLRASARPDAAGRLAGDLWVDGGGDPAPGRGAASLEALEPFVGALKAAGVRSVAGGVRVRDGWFDATPWGPGWNWDDLPEGYGAPVGGLVFADNAARVVVRGGNAPGDPALIRTEPLDGVFRVAAQVRTVATNRPTRIRLVRMPGSDLLEVRGEIGVRQTRAERMAVPDGAVWFGRALKEALVAGGVPVSGGVEAGAGVRPPELELARVSSLPMAELAALCLKPSNNLIAHQLWLQVGADVRARASGSGMAGTDDSGRAEGVLREFMAKAGVGAGEITMEEGSGLSRKNLVTPAATVRLLRFMSAHPAGPAFRAALPVGGVDGTLRSRFALPPLKGRVVAKTGTLRHVHALGGYLTTVGGEPLVFAVYVNGYHPGTDGASAREEMDRMVEWVVRHDGKAGAR